MTSCVSSPYGTQKGIALHDGEIRRIRQENQVPARREFEDRLEIRFWNRNGALRHASPVFSLLFIVCHSKSLINLSLKLIPLFSCVKREG